MRSIPSKRQETHCIDKQFEPRSQPFPEHERRILELRFAFDGQQQSVAAIECALGVSRERVRRLKQHALAQLASDLEGVVEAREDEPSQAARGALQTCATPRAVA